jgi:hypothetical protein
VSIELGRARSGYDILSEPFRRAELASRLVARYRRISGGVEQQIFDSVGGSKHVCCRLPLSSRFPSDGDDG